MVTFLMLSTATFPSTWHYLAQSLYSHCSTRFAVAMSHPVLVLYLSMVHHQVVDYQALDKLAFSRCFSKALIYLQWYIAEKCSNVADSTHDAADGTNDDAADPDVTGRLVADPQLPLGIST